MPFYPISNSVACFIACFLFVCAAVIHSRSQRRKRSKGLPLPPGPKGYPILGNTLEAIDPSRKPWDRFAQWKKESGARHLLTVHTLGQTNMFIFNAQVAMDLFEKRGAVYAARPPAVFVNELVNKEMLLVVNSNPDRVKKLRKLLHEQFSHVGAEDFQDIQLEEASHLLSDLLEKPDELDACLKKSLQRLVLRTTYGRELSVTADEMWAHVKYAAERPQPGIGPILSCYPILKHWPTWLPGGGFHKVAEEYFQRDKAIWERVRDDVKKGMEDGRVSPTSCLLSRMYATDAPQRLGFSELDMAFVAANLFTAGGDLPEITIRILVAAMLHFPHVLKKAQAEIDAVVGRQRLPTFDDKNALPYTRAVILETQRWRTLAPIGVAHASTEDDVYEGYFIPKGTVVFPNLYAMSQDPEVYPEPEAFVPERFLSADGRTLVRKNELATFGYGRRSVALFFSHQGDKHGQAVFGAAFCRSDAFCGRGQLTLGV